MTAFKSACVLVVMASTMTGVALANNNQNPSGSLCLDVRGAGMETAQGSCQSSAADCAAGSFCVDSDFDPLNQGICVDRAWFGLGSSVVVDVEMGPSSEPACGGQVFLEWDNQALSFVSLESDPDGETGWSFSLRETIDEVAGTIDLALALPIGTSCNAVTGTTSGATVARLTFIAATPGNSTGVRFRSNDPMSGISGGLGVIPVTGCDGDTEPTGTSLLYIDPCPFDDPDDTDGDGVCESDDVCPGLNDVPDFNSDGFPDCLCGNGFIDGDEECDDGRTDDGDGCASNCLYEGNVPTLSQWGMILLSSVLLIGVAVRSRRPRPGAA